MSVPPISGVIIAFNEEERIARAVASLLPWCGEVLVLDSLSTDRTRQQAEAAGARVLSQQFLGHQAQKNRAVELAAHDWILSLDADEVLVGNAAELLAGLDLTLEERVYRIPRRNWYLGGWVDATGWRRDSSVRLFNRRRARFGGSTVHDRAGGPGCEERPLAALIHHWPYRDMGHHLAKINSYTDALAAEMDGQGRRFSPFKLLLDPPWKFLREFVLLGGWRLGLRGFVLSVLAAFYVFAKYAKLWEKQCVPPGSGEGEGGDGQYGRDGQYGQDGRGLPVGEDPSGPSGPYRPSSPYGPSGPSRPSTPQDSPSGPTSPDTP